MTDGQIFEYVVKKESEINDEEPESGSKYQSDTNVNKEEEKISESSSENDRKIADHPVSPQEIELISIQNPSEIRNVDAC